MKAGFILFAGCVLLMATGCSQSHQIVKGYAFARNVMPGVKPGVSLNEDGTVTKRQSQPGIQYFIYTKTKDSTKPEVKNVWIKGIQYAAHIEKAKDFPLAIAEDSSILNRDSLAGARGLITWQINVGEMISSSHKNFDKPSQLEEPEVLISYLYKNKIQYFSVSKLKYLEPLRLQ
ncbi:MAG: hypothetical protein ABI594_05740 [Ginsengibacter sp.]